MFTNLTNSLSILQHVHFLNHINGNIIYLVFSSSLHSELMMNTISRIDLLSDHFRIYLKTNFTKKTTLHLKTRITYIHIIYINYMIYLAYLHS